MLGTILPTRKSIAADNEYAQKLKNDKAKVGKSIKGERRVVGGEVRYYQTKSIYLVVNSRLKICKFEVRKDGDYFIGYEKN